MATLPPVPENYVYIGCFPDGMLRLLDGAVQKLDIMTLPRCVDYCNSVSLSRFYPLIGTEHANSCYCGSGFARDVGIHNELGCNNPCAGDNKTICGGQGYINVYNATKMATTLTPPATTLPGVQVITLVATVTQTADSVGATSASSSTPVMTGVGGVDKGPNKTIMELTIAAGVLGACFLVVSVILFLVVRKRLLRKWSGETSKSVLSSTLVGTDHVSGKQSYEDHEMFPQSPRGEGGFYEVPHVGPR